MHHSIELFHQPTLTHNFLYSLTICLLHYYPRHVSSINMPIFRRKNCIHTASGIFALCKRLHSTVHSVTNILLMNKENCALKLVDEIILYCDARSKKHQIFLELFHFTLPSLRSSCKWPFSRFALQFTHSVHPFPNLRFCTV